MFLLATLWAAVLNIVILAVALAWTPDFWMDATHWLMALPWRTFGTELGALLQMQSVHASAVWALWLCVSTVLLGVGLLAYAVVKRNTLPVGVGALPTPEVADMFGQLSNSLDGLGGFGDVDPPVQKSVKPDLGPASPLAGPPLEPLAGTPQQPTPAALGSSLQEIDPELGASYDALVRELASTAPPK
jgi:hypothetical protein